MYPTTGTGNDNIYGYNNKKREREGMVEAPFDLSFSVVGCTFGVEHLTHRC